MPDWFSYLTRSLEQARQEKVNLLILEINSTGGMETEGDNLADLISSIKDMKTVAYIDDRATGVAALLPLACRDIVFSKKARMGDVRQVIGGGGGRLLDLTDLMRHEPGKKSRNAGAAKGTS